MEYKDFGFLDLSIRSKKPIQESVQSIPVLEAIQTLSPTRLGFSFLLGQRSQKKTSILLNSSPS